MNADITCFRALYPEFDPLPDALIEMYLQDAKDSLSKTQWGLCYNKAVLCLTAHNLALAQQRQSTAETDENGHVIVNQTGTLASASAGGLSVSFAPSNAPSTGGDDWYRQTPYGQRFLALRHEYLPRMRLIDGR